MTLKQIYPEDIRVTVPDEIERAHQRMTDAEKAYRKALKDYAPACPLQVGDKILVQEHTNGSWTHAVIKVVNYMPYWIGTFYGYRIAAIPMIKDWKRKSRTRFSYIWLKERHTIQLKTD